MTFLYGDRDWMDPRGGQRALAGARQHRQATTPGDLRLFTVKKSGHYTFIDQVLITRSAGPICVKLGAYHRHELALQARVRAPYLPQAGQLPRPRCDRATQV